VGSNRKLSVTIWLGFNVIGNVAPDTVNPVPVNAAELMVTGAVPVEVKVTGCVDAVLTVTLPNVREAALVVSCGIGAAVPVPLRLTTAVLPVDELLWIVSCPSAAPVTVGSKCAFSVTDWLGFSATGKAAPEIVKPVPVTAADLMVSGAVPVEVSVTGFVDAVFTVTLPKVRLAVLIVNCGLGAAVPVPLRLTTAVLPTGESLWIFRCPAAAPVAVGSNRTFSVTDWLGFSVTGKAAPDMVKPVPVSVAELMVTGEVPVDVNVTGCVAAEPSVTLPNVKLSALTARAGVELLTLIPNPSIEP
jgi:hydrogenase/urease accessory protein HupE